MLKRTITSLCLILIFIPICIFSDTVVFPLAMAILSFASVYEMLGCVGMSKAVAICIPSYVFGFFLPCLPWMIQKEKIDTAILSICMIYLIVILAVNVFSRGSIEFSNSSSAFMMIFYNTVAFTSIVLIRQMNAYLYLLVFIGPWISDIFAYLCGRLFGKHKLIPEISPKKTVEGSIGGIIFAAISFVVYAFIVKSYFVESAFLPFGVMAISGAVISVISQIGDLSASAVKRCFGIKDYGWIFPGHGGVLDRFDSVLLTAPVLYMMTRLLGLMG